MIYVVVVTIVRSCSSGAGSVSSTGVFTIVTTLASPIFLFFFSVFLTFARLIDRRTARSTRPDAGHRAAATRRLSSGRISNLHFSIEASNSQEQQASLCNRLLQQNAARRMLDWLSYSLVEMSMGVCMCAVLHCAVASKSWNSVSGQPSRRLRPLPSPRVSTLMNSRLSPCICFRLLVQMCRQH